MAKTAALRVNLDSGGMSDVSGQECPFLEGDYKQVRGLQTIRQFL